MTKSVNEEKNYLPSVLRFLILHLAGLTVFFVGYSHTALFFFILFYLIRFTGVSVAYHRYFSHRSFKTGRKFQFFLALLGSTSGQRGPLWWAAGHRKHHRYSDTEKDIHSPHHRSLWFSHIGWVLQKESLETDMTQVQDFKKYPELLWLNNNHSIGVILSFVFLAVTGALLDKYFPGLETSASQLIVWGGVLSTLLCCHTVLGLNSLCHLTGTKAYPSKDESRNIWWMAPLYLGEHLHNNHHFYPSSHTAAFAKHEFDQMGLLIRGFEKLGLVWDVRRPEQSRAMEQRIDTEDSTTLLPEAT